MNYQAKPLTSISHLAYSKPKLHIGTHNTRETLQWANHREDIDTSPHSSHSINTPLNPTSYSNLSNRPNSKEKISNKIENYSKFSNRNIDNIPLEKSQNLENSSMDNRYFNTNSNSKNIKNINVSEESKSTINYLNFKKKDEISKGNSSISSISSLEKSSYKLNDGFSSENSSKKYPFPFTPKLKLKREMAGLRNIGNTCFL